MADSPTDGVTPVSWPASPSARAIPRPAPRVAPAATAIVPASGRLGTGSSATLETCLGVRLVGISYGYWRFQKASIMRAIVWFARPTTTPSRSTRTTGFSASGSLHDDYSH